jgi:hypothetical protein
MKENPIWKYGREMADEVHFEFLRSQLVLYVLANSEKDETLIDKWLLLPIAGSPQIVSLFWSICQAVTTHLQMNRSLVLIWG